MRLSRQSSRVALGLVFLIAAALRFLWLDGGWFGADQARDLAWGEAIASGSAFPDAGPAMRNHLRLGSTYYYFWSIPSFLSREPVASYAFAALLGVVSVLATARLTGRLGGQVAALAAAAWLATSPVAVLDTRVAWAPAALPALVAIFFLAVLRVQARPRVATVALMFFLAAFTTQLHLSAVSLLAVAVVVLFGVRRSVGWRGPAAAALGALVPLLPMALAASSPLAASESLAAVPSSFAGRMGGLFLHAGRVLDGLSPVGGARPWLASVWIDLERAAFPLVLLAALVVLLRRRAAPGTGSEVRRQGVGAVLLGFGLAVLFVAALPTEAWYYYLDVALVPGAALIGLVVAAGRYRHWMSAGLAVVVVVRALGLLWWIWTAHATGVVAANLDLLRLGGASTENMHLRARLPTVATKQRAVDVLVGDLAIAPQRAFTDVHGAGFTDLVSDNGYFVHRARWLGPDRGLSAVVVHHGDLPAAWIEGMVETRVPPLQILAYEALLDVASARIEGCGVHDTLPAAIVPQPRAYGTGAPLRQRWPCRRPTVVVPIRAGAEVLRVVARVVGSGRVVSIVSEPPGRSGSGALPGGGEVLLVPRLPALLRVELRIDGPADLDLFELHGGALHGSSSGW